MFVDTHLHTHYNGFSSQDVMTYLDRERIDQAWLLTWEEISPSRKKEYQHLSIEDVFELHQRHPDRIIPMYAPDPNKPEVEKEIEHWHQKGIKGYAELKVSLTWDSPLITKVLNIVEKLNLPVIFHMQEVEVCFAAKSDRIMDRVLCRILNSSSPTLKTPRTWLQQVAESFQPIKDKIQSQVTFPGYMLDFVALERVLQRYPHVRFIGHGPFFWKNISGESSKEHYPTGKIGEKGLIWRLLEKYSNLYVDTSGKSGLNALQRDPVVAREFLSTFEGKVLYATDNYWKGQKEYLLSLNLSDQTYRKVFSDNALRLLQSPTSHVRSA